MSPLDPPEGEEVPDVIPRLERASDFVVAPVPPLSIGQTLEIMFLTCATRSRVRLISRAPQRTRPSSPVSGTRGYPAADASSPTAMSASFMRWPSKYPQELQPTSGCRSKSAMYRGWL